MLVYYFYWLATHTFSYLFVRKIENRRCTCVKKVAGNLKLMKCEASCLELHKTAVRHATRQLMKMKSCSED